MLKVRQLSKLISKYNSKVDELEALKLNSCIEIKSYLTENLSKCDEYNVKFKVQETEFGNDKIKMQNIKSEVEKIICEPTFENKYDYDPHIRCFIYPGCQLEIDIILNELNITYYYKQDLYDFFVLDEALEYEVEETEIIRDLINEINDKSGHKKLWDLIEYLQLLSEQILTENHSTFWKMYEMIEHDKINEIYSAGMKLYECSEEIDESYFIEIIQLEQDSILVKEHMDNSTSETKYSYTEFVRSCISLIEKPEDKRERILDQLLSNQ